MKRIARFGIVVLAAFLLMSCLTDPVELPNEGNGNTNIEIGQNANPNEKPDNKPDPKPEVKPSVSSEYEFPEWFRGKKLFTISVSIKDRDGNITSVEGDDGTVTTGPSLDTIKIPENVEFKCSKDEKHYELLIIEKAVDVPNGEEQIINGGKITINKDKDKISGEYIITYFIEQYENGKTSSFTIKYKYAE